MSTLIVRRQATPATVEKLRVIFGQLAGKIDDPTGATKDLLRVLGMQFLSLVRDAYIAKARGGRGSDGITWKPLSAKAIAYGRRHPGLAAKRSKAINSRRPLLTAKQDEKWRAIFAGTYRRLQARGEGNAAGNAAALAWAIIKAEGGRTILSEYGGARVEIGRDTGRLLASLSPGHPDAFWQQGAGYIEGGTNVVYAYKFHSIRPIFPTDMPEAWAKRLEETLQDGIDRLLERAS